MNYNNDVRESMTAHTVYIAPVGGAGAARMIIIDSFGDELAVHLPTQDFTRTVAEALHSIANHSATSEGPTTD